MFIMVEGNYDLLALADFSNNSGVIRAFFDYIEIKKDADPCRYDEGRYEDFNIYGDYIYERPVSYTHLKLGYNFSGSANGAMLIKSHSSASGGYYVSGLFYRGGYLQFEIDSDKAVELSLIHISLLYQRARYK